MGRACTPCPSSRSGLLLSCDGGRARLNQLNAYDDPREGREHAHEDWGALFSPAQRRLVANVTGCSGCVGPRAHDLRLGIRTPWPL